MCVRPWTFEASTTTRSLSNHRVLLCNGVAHTRTAAFPDRSIPTSSFYGFYTILRQINTGVISCALVNELRLLYTLNHGEIVTTKTQGFLITLQRSSGEQWNSCYHTTTIWCIIIAFITWVLPKEISHIHFFYMTDLITGIPIKYRDSPISYRVRILYRAVPITYRDAR